MMIEETIKNNKITLIGGGLAVGGQERALVNLANYCAKSGYEVSIVNLFKTEIFFDLHPDIKICWPTVNRDTSHRLIYAIKLIFYIRSEVKKAHSDVIISFGEWFNSYVIFATRFLKVRVFVSNRMGPNLKLGFLLDNANKFFYKYATGIIAQTNQAKKIIELRTGATKIHVIPNAVHPIDVKCVTKNNQIISVGRLSKEKGHLSLIKAFSKCKNDNWSLHFVGDGNQKDTLIYETEKLQIKEKVIFHGHLKDFSSILASSNIFVLPSFYEGFPNALVEAMSVPLACISSDCVAGPSDIIDNGINGILYETGNCEALTAELDYLMFNESKRIEMASSAFQVREKYKFETIANQYLSVLFSQS